MMAGFEDGDAFAEGADGLYGVEVALCFDLGNGGHQGFELGIVDLILSVEALVDLLLLSSGFLILSVEALVDLLLLSSGFLILSVEALIDLLLKVGELMVVLLLVAGYKGLEFAQVGGDEILNDFLDGLGYVVGHENLNTIIVQGQPPRSMRWTWGRG